MVQEFLDFRDRCQRRSMADCRQLDGAGELGEFESGHVRFDDQIGRLNTNGIDAGALDQKTAQDGLNGRSGSHAGNGRVGSISGEFGFK